MKKTFVCPFCQMKIMQEEVAAGRSIQCPKCNHFFQLKLSPEDIAANSDRNMTSNSTNTSSLTSAASTASSPFGVFSEEMPGSSDSNSNQESQYVANPLKKQNGNDGSESARTEEPVFVREGVVVNPLRKKKDKDLSTEELDVSLEVDENGNIENPLAKIRAARRQKEQNNRKKNIEVDEMIASLLEEQQKENNRLEAAHNRKAPKDRTPVGPIETENNPLVAGIEIVYPVPSKINKAELAEEGDTYDFEENDPNDLEDLESEVNTSGNSSRSRNYKTKTKGIGLLFSLKKFEHPQRNKLLQLQGDCKNRFWIFFFVCAVIMIVQASLRFIPEDQMAEIYKYVAKEQLTKYLYYFGNSVIALTGLFFLLKYVELLKILLGLEGMLIALVLSLVPILNLVIIYLVIKRSGESGISRYSS